MDRQGAYLAANVRQPLAALPADQAALAVHPGVAQVRAAAYLAANVRQPLVVLGAHLGAQEVPVVHPGVVQVRAVAYLAANVRQPLVVLGVHLGARGVPVVRPEVARVRAVAYLVHDRLNPRLVDRVVRAVRARRAVDQAVAVARLDREVACLVDRQADPGRWAAAHLVGQANSARVDLAREARVVRADRLVQAVQALAVYLAEATAPPVQ